MTRGHVKVDRQGGWSAVLPELVESHPLPQIETLGNGVTLSPCRLSTV